MGWREASYQLHVRAQNRTARPQKAPEITSFDEEGCAPWGLIWLLSTAIRVMVRGPNWARKGLGHLAEAWVATTENPVLGIDQTSEAFRVGLHRNFIAMDEN